MSDHDETIVAKAVSTRRDRPDRAYLIVLAGTNVGEMYKVATDRLVIGRGRSADVALLDEGISRSHAEISTRGEAVTIRDLESRNGTFCNGERITEHVLRDGDKIQVGQTTILKFTYHDDLDESFQRRMYDSALRDGLTGAFNRRYFTSQLAGEVGFARRHGSPLALVLADLDDLKGINDRDGHPAGDQALKEIAATLARLIRSEDVLARIGGDEFAIVCRAIDLEGARQLAERLRAAVGDGPLRLDAGEVRATLSLGVAELSPARVPDADALVAAADRALYRAKHAGRNRVAVDQDETPEEDEGDATSS